ncbi:unnamed protein product [Absidia cylindrospora]
MIDTNVGYTATVTSFRREDFFQLCRAMTMESDLRYIKYVWVDAICIDQTNYEKRKATIHEMTNIYERAQYVVAVPDLHLQYLKNISTNNRTLIQRAARFRKDIYYLLHKRIDALMVLEEQQLDYFGVPKNPALRQLLTKYTNFFTDGFTKFREHHYHYNPEEILDHIYESSRLLSPTTPTPDVPSANTTNDDLFKEIERLHHCNKATCPFVCFFHHHHNNKLNHHHHHHHNRHHPFISAADRSGRNREWKQQIYDRSMIIQQAMRFLTDLITDWSSRAWVISEFNIAKKKNNLKYWFIQLLPTSMPYDFDEMPFSFFEFNFDDPSHATIQNTMITNHHHHHHHHHRGLKAAASDPVYLKFHQRMIRQLKDQTFLEMMLRSKASKAEDRFYSILPLSHKYKDKLTTKESVAGWRIQNMLSVKLKLFEWMDTKDKLTLLFLSSYRKHDLTLILPTFATITIYWHPSVSHCLMDDSTAPNFDMAKDASTLTLHHTQELHYLCLRPFEYYVHNNYHHHKEACRAFLLEKTALCKRVQLDEGTLDVVAIPNIASRGSSLKQNSSVCWIHLIGSFAKNKWVFDKCSLSCSPTDPSDWIRYDCHDHHHFSGFNIY